MFDFYTRLAFGAIDLFIPLSLRRVAAGALVGEVFGARCSDLERILLTSVSAVVVQPGFIAMQQELPNCWLSCSLAAVALALWIKPVELSTPMCAFMPKYHCPALYACCVSGSQTLSKFLVELGAEKIVASTMVPPHSFSPPASQPIAAHRF